MTLFDDIKASANGRVRLLVSSWLPTGQITGDQLLVNNPTRTDKKPSLSVNLETGAYNDFAIGDKGGDFIAPRAYLDRSSQVDAARKIAVELGIKTADPSRAEGKPTVTPICPIPDDARPPPASFPPLGTYSKAWCYRDAEGRAHWYQCRFETEAGKEFRPLAYCQIGGECGRLAWHPKAPPAPRMLYGLDRIAGDQDAIVLIVEGEKTADAANELFAGQGYVAASPMNGAQSPRCADWSPLAGREVCICGDNDEPGQQFAKAVAGLAIAAGANSVSIVELPTGLPPKWDLADPIPDGLDPLQWLDAAKPYVPDIGDDIRKAGGDIQGQFALLRQAADIDGERRSAGVYSRTEEEDKETGETTFRWLKLSSVVEVLADARDGSSKNWGRWLEVHNPDGVKHRWPMPATQLANNSGELIREELLRLGCWISAHAGPRRLLHQYLCSWWAKRRVRCATQTGWCQGVYVLPDRAYGPGHEDVIFQPEGRVPDAVKCGTLKGWQTEVAALCLGNDRLILGIVVALAGPVLQLIGEPSFGVHLRGPSSIGKSKALKVAGSVSGAKEQPDTWRKTDNALEGEAALDNDRLLILDEIGEGDAKAISNAVYMLANERGKGRMTKSGGIREPLTWRLTFMSSGEIGLATKLAEAGIRAKAGQQIRLIDLTADAGAGFGLFQNLHGENNGDRFARRIDTACKSQQGTALRAWVDMLALDIEGFKTRILAAREAFLKELKLPSDADGQIHRAAGRFAVLAAVGEVAQTITGWPEVTARNAMTHLFLEWLRDRGTERAEDREAVETVKAYIETYGDARFTDPWNDQEAQLAEDKIAENFGREARKLPKARAFQRAGFRKLNEQGEADYLILPEVWREEVCRGLDHKLVARVLYQKGYLEIENEGRTDKLIRVPGISKRSRVYWVRSSIMEASD